jgi:hypothetical protein
MKLRVPVWATMLLVIGALAMPAQEPQTAAETTKARAKAAASDTDVTYGRIKEFTAGQKVVIDIDNAPDKEFDLTSKDVAVKMPKGLKSGDTVKVTEQDVAGKTKSVTIAKHSGGGVAHGDKDPAAKKP